MSTSSTTTQGTAVTFTATVTPNQAGGPANTGEVWFSTTNRSVNIGYVAVQITNGQAQLTTNTRSNFLPTGSDTITATYRGDNNYASSSGSMTEIVNPQPGTDFSLAASPSSVTIPTPGGSSAPVTVTVTPLSGFSGTVNFSPASCSISPAGSLSTCSISLTSVSTSGGTQVTIYTTASSLALRGPHAFPDNFAQREILACGTLCAFVLLLALRTKRQRLSFVFGLVLLAFVSAACVGCGSSGASGAGGAGGKNPGTPTGVTYTVTVTGSCGALSHNASFTFVVQ